MVKRFSLFENLCCNFLFLVFWVAIALAVSFTIGCISTPTKDASVFKFDLQAQANGLDFQGTGVLPKAPLYTLRITSTNSVDLFTISTCHREFTITDAITTGWLKPKQSYEFSFTPIPGIEDRGSCLIRMGAYSKSDGQNAWALLDIEDQTAILPARNDCNGEQLATRGASICQARVGLIQRISFPEEVRLSLNAVKEECKIPEPLDKRVWEYEMPKGECIFAFGTISAPLRVHRHTTVGYDLIKIRGDN